MRDYSRELEKRTGFIRETVKSAGALGVIFGNSGGKDSALVAILCVKAGVKVLGVQMPCHASRNFGEDMNDALNLADQFHIPWVTVDLSGTKDEIAEAIQKGDGFSWDGGGGISPAASANIAPRLRMTALYTIGQSLNYLVAGTGNRSERFVGYFTKHGDGACDFNPIADLTVREIYEFLEYLGAPGNIVKKAPSAGLFEGQTDETEMGFSYKELDEYILNGKKGANAVTIENLHNKTRHKRELPKLFE